MKAMILAAGLGSRLQSLTKFKPKALIEVAGKPIMAYQLDALIANGISHIGVVTGYQGDKIRSFVSKFYPNLRVCFFHRQLTDKKTIIKFNKQNVRNGSDHDPSWRNGMECGTTLPGTS